MKTFRLSIRLTLIIVLTCVATLRPGSLGAATLLVYNTNDSGAGSLRAVLAAATNGDTIDATGISGTITLTSGELLVNCNVAIVGPGANVLAADGHHASHVFHINTNVVVSISGLTITQGYGNFGGGIYNDHATLTLSNCMVSFNSCVNWGAGILNDGSGLGSATLTVIASSLSSNSCQFGGGGIANDGAYSGRATLTVIASTLNDNSASDAGIENNAYGSGSATLAIGDTILKMEPGGTNIVNVYGGAITSAGYNLYSDNGAGYLTALGDQPNTDPMLGSLQDNGGPTRTVLPLPGSPAIDQGKNISGLATDQRGRCRTYDDPGIPNASGGDGTDIGAVEVSPAHGGAVATTNENGVSVRWCICDAQPGDTITFAPSLTGTVGLTAGELFISKNVAILGPGANVLAINAEAASRVFHLSNSVVTISGLTITNGDEPGGLGSGILNEHGTLTLSNCVISGNSDADFGAGVFNNGEVNSATLTLVGTMVSGNSALIGAAIYNDGEFGHATLTVITSTLCSNSATYRGGGIYNDGDGPGSSVALTVIGSTLNGNSAGSLAGGIYNRGADGGAATLQVGDTILKAGSPGANLYNEIGTIISLGYNFSSDDGGGFLASTGDQINTEPLLGPLQNNGGPTPTMALLAGSPAIDRGKSFGLSTDQRGAPRPYDFSNITNASGGDGSDIGAFEVQLPLLNIQKAGNAAVLSWPNYYGNFSVQTNGSLSASGGWGNAPGTASVLSTQYVLTNSPLSGNRFFRLKSNLTLKREVTPFATQSVI